MIAPLARILVRYAAGALVAKGLIDVAMSDQLASDAELAGVVQTALGFVAAGVTEGFYFLARKLGWSK